MTSCIIHASNWREPANSSIKSFLYRTTFGNDHLQLVENTENDRKFASSKWKCDPTSPWKTVNMRRKKIALFSILAIKKVIGRCFQKLFFKYNPEIGTWSQNPENHNLWGRLDRYVLDENDESLVFVTIWDCWMHVRMTLMTSSVKWTDLDFKISVALVGREWL